jgi:hypothetical protein
MKVMYKTMMGNISKQKKEITEADFKALFDFLVNNNISF